MNSFDFYTSIYFRELNRRKDLDDAINLPVTVLTLLAGFNWWIADKTSVGMPEGPFDLDDVMLILVGLSFTTCLFFLIRSYNNLFKGFAYRNFAMMQRIREFEMEIPEYNMKSSQNDQIDFEHKLVERLISITDHHTFFNDKRQLDLYKAKTLLIFVLVLTCIRFSFIIANFEIIIIK